MSLDASVVLTRASSAGDIGVILPHGCACWVSIGAVIPGGPVLVGLRYRSNFRGERITFNLYALGFFFECGDGLRG